jgi:hypothetical protein
LVLRTYLVYNTVVAGARSLLRPEKKSSSRLSGGLCCCVSFWFWRKIGFGCTYYYVLGVPYGCGVVLVFFFWREIIFGVTYVLSIQYSCAVVSFFCCGGKVSLRPEKKSSSRLSGGLCCFVSFWFWREIGFGCTYYYVFM